MKVLWITNVMLPDACEALHLPPTVVGGWMCGYRDALLKYHSDVELHIVSPYTQDKTFDVTTPLAHHYLFPQATIHGKWFEEINDQVKPDVIHIHGTEFPHSLLWAETCGMQKTLVSVQGLVSQIAERYMGGLRNDELRCSWSLNDYRYRRTLQQQQARMMKRGLSEVNLLKQAQHIAGRTTWDRKNALAINPKAQYHKLQEVLRQDFYADGIHWQLGQCQRHSIFISQCYYPIKGLHRLLDAMPQIITQYPDTQLYVVGEDGRRQHWWHRTQYANILAKKMKGFGSHVHYLGFLSAEQMIEQYRHAHVFVCPSSIENSSNSVCEAQMIGTPVVAANVGGMADLIEHEKSGMLYDFEETDKLAAHICKLFADDELADKFSTNERQAARLRHDRRSTSDTLYNIYREICDKADNS